MFEHSSDFFNCLPGTSPFSNHMHNLILLLNPLNNPARSVLLLAPISRKLRHREVKGLSQDNTAAKKENQDLDPHSLTTNPTFLITILSPSPSRPPSLLSLFQSWIVNMRVECADTLRTFWSLVPCVCSFIQEVRFEHLLCAGCVCFRCWDFSGSAPHSVGSSHYRWASIKSSPQYVMESAWGWSGKASWRSDAGSEL